MTDLIDTPEKFNAAYNLIMSSGMRDLFNPSRESVEAAKRAMMSDPIEPSRMERALKDSIKAMVWQNAPASGNASSMWRLDDPDADFRRAFRGGGCE